jgi:hypothetical protein
LEQVLEALWQQKKRKICDGKYDKPPYDRNMTFNHTFGENPVESSQVEVEQE